MIKYLLTLCSIVGVLSCQRQELEDPYQFLAHIPVSINWDESLLDLDQVGNVSIYFYPEDGGDPVVKLSDNIYYNLVELPMGRYSVLIFNDLADNIEGVEIFNLSKHTSCSANIVKGNPTTPSFYTLSDDEVLATPHGRVASWCMESFEVDDTMIEYTRSQEFEAYIEQVKSRAGSRATETEGVATLPTISSLDVELTKSITKSLTELSNVVMQPETTIVNIDVRVENLNNAMTFETILRGTASGSALTYDLNIAVEGQTPIYHLIVANRSYDDPTNGIDGYVSYSHNTFGRISQDEEYTIIFKIALMSGAMCEFERDVTDQFLTSDGHVVDIVIGDIDFEDANEPIVLPPFSEAGFNVGDWNNEIVYL